MPATTTPTRTEQLQREFGELRAKVDLLPERQRNALETLIDRAKLECVKLHENAAQLSDARDDLHLTTACARFDMEATCREIQEALDDNDVAPAVEH